MGCPVSKRVRTSSELTPTPAAQTTPDENSNGFVYQSSRRQLMPDSHNNTTPNQQNIPGQINNHMGAVLLKTRQSTRTQSQVEFFAMLDSKIEAGEDLKEDES